MVVGLAPNVLVDTGRTGLGAAREDLYVDADVAGLRTGGIETWFRTTAAVLAVIGRVDAGLVLKSLLRGGSLGPSRLVPVAVVMLLAALEIGGRRRGTGFILGFAFIPGADRIVVVEDVVRFLGAMRLGIAADFDAGCFTRANGSSSADAQC